MPELQDKVAVVTGGSRGIGRAIALALGGAGARVAVTCTQQRGAAEEVIAALKAMGSEGRVYQFDVADFEAVSQAFDQIIADFGGLDVLVSNAGVTRDQLLVRMKPAEWDVVLQTNLTGTFNCSRAAARTMLRQRSGRIVNITSVAGLTGNPGQTNYAASKAGIVGFTKALAKELAPRNVTVNAVAPGFIETDMTQVLPDSQRQAVLQQIPAARFGVPEDVAACVLFLSSERAQYITGEVIRVSGGLAI
ncbi:MAG: 3-oxoacyl-[acyl-carrier-protein] reductase [Candidatus Tectomicrobia bacterium]|nr:3-oxoacyl-[acyl-carrier-protein] reductase [Candidatus Tectomicrobia bacterium]